MEYTYYRFHVSKLHEKKLKKSNHQHNFPKNILLISWKMLHTEVRTRI